MTQELVINDDVRRIFTMRYYRWALKDAEREIVEGFPLLKQIKDASALRFLETMELFSVEEQISYAKICVRHSFQKELESTNECFTAQEAEQYEIFCRKERASRHKVTQQKIIHEASGKLNQKRLKYQIKREFKQLFGEPHYRNGGNDFGYRMTVASWSINTYIEIGGRKQLSYTHIIIPASPPDLQIKPLACPELLVWLGVGRTSWSLITNSDIEEAAASLVLICSHFIQVAPELLSDLSPSGSNT